MDKSTVKKIWNAVDNLEKNPELLAKVSPRKFINEKFLKDEKGNYITYHKFNGTYHENYRLIKSLNLGHHPTKEETDEVKFYSVAKLMGNGDAKKGIEKFAQQFKH